MKRFMTHATVLTAAFLTTATIATAATITVYPSIAPNAFGSPSYAAYVNNATTALYNGASAGGTPGLPTYYQQISGSISISQMIVSGFPSWNGYADPGVVFGPAFAAELGNRPLMGLKIDKDGGPQFSIGQLAFNQTSSDIGNYLGFGFGAGAYNYSLDYVGVLFGLDGVWGGGDDTFITSGLNSQLVDGLVGRGSGNAPAVYLTDPGLTNQDKIDNALAYFTDPFSVTGTYTLGADTGSGTFNVVPVPEPTSMSLAALGGLSLLFVRRRR